MLASAQAARDNGEVAHIIPGPPRPLPAVTGWTCPGCGHCYAPWIPECHHCPEPPAFIAKGNDPGPIEVGRP